MQTRPLLSCSEFLTLPQTNTERWRMNPFAEVSRSEHRHEVSSEASRWPRPTPLFRVISAAPEQES
jgi:hypothetical protein